MTVKVQIPGEMIATVVDGQVHFTFSPLGSYAGYFGEDFFILEDEEITPEEFWPMVSKTLVSTTRETAHFICEWAE